MIPDDRFSLAAALSELETAVGLYLLLEQEGGHASSPARGALARLTHALARVHWCRSLADEIYRETGQPALQVISGALWTTHDREDRIEDAGAHEY